MKLSPKGQHTLEHMILLILIMAGIIIGGPYAIRSWNAQMKGWEDSVVDSMTDPLMEAPASAVTVPGCDFISWLNQGCGLGYTSPFGDSISCPEQKMLQMGVFNPNNCQFSNPYTPFSQIAQCVADNSFDCCTPWVLPSGCDITNPGCPQTSDCGVTVGCPDGQYRRTRDCDEVETQSECVPDTDCDFLCDGSLLPNPLPADRMQPCVASGDTDDETGLTDDKNYDLVDVCTETKCEVDCLGDLIPNLAGTQCVCPAGLTETWNAAASVWECTCGAGSALQCTDTTPVCSVPGNCCQPCTSGPFAGMPGYCQQY